MSDFKKQNNDVMEKYIKNSLKIENSLRQAKRSPRVEFILTSDCNLKCEYCYLYRHGDSLYPKEIRNHSDIIKNVGIMTDYLIKNSVNCSVEIFSGEPLIQKIGYDTLDVMYEKLSTSNNVVSHIVIPTNMSFISNDSFVEKVQYNIDRFKKIGTDMRLSASVDGKYIDDLSRPNKNNKTRNDDYYDRFFKFVKKNDVGLHPMVSAYSIEHWIDNYNWFIENSEAYGLSNKFRIMMLEVRNDDWTPDKISSYMKFLNHVVNVRFNHFNNDPHKLYNNIKKVPGFYDNIRINYSNGSGDKISCAIQDTLVVRMGDLSIVPCHRTMYNQFIYGKFVCESDEIVGCESYNNSLMLTIPTIISKNQPKCNSCVIANTCSKGCLGSQFEVNNDLFYPIQSVCDLYKNKIYFLIRKYKHLGVFDYFEESIASELNMIEEELSHEYGDRYNELIL